MRIVKDIIWRTVCQELQNGNEKIDSSLTRKTEFIVFASERQRKKVTSMEIDIDGIKVRAADEIKYV